MEIKIRELKEEDIEEIVKLKVSLFNFHVKIDKFYTPKKNIKQLYRDHLQTILASEDHRVFVAKEGEKILGFIEGSIFQISEFFEKNVLGSVSEIFVKQKYRKHGIAKDLLQCLIKWFGKRRIKTIEVVVDSRNKNAIRAWAKLGFVEYQKKMVLKP